MVKPYIKSYKLMGNIYFNTKNELIFLKWKNE